MSRLNHPVFMITIAIGAFALGLAARMAKAQDPVTVDPENYKVLFEDSDVRVLRYDDTPGHFVPKHTHPYPYRVYVITPAIREFLSLDAEGKDCQKAAVPTKLFANDELMRPPVTHCEANIGTTPTHLILFEFKKQAPAP